MGVSWRDHYSKKNPSRLEALLAKRRRKKSWTEGVDIPREAWYTTKATKKEQEADLTAEEISVGRADGTTWLVGRSGRTRGSTIQLRMELKT